MGRIRPHRRSSYGNQLKALPIEAMYASGVSLFTLIIFGVVIGVSVYMSGETPKLLGGIGMLGFFIALAAMLYNIGQMKTKTELKYRITCMTISAVVMIIWIAPYVLGLIN
ncbi:MAG: hypothetical protein IJR96_01125 [Pseudobutyrivibrio sp.]|nr:hypothetical protein [Pseudobutyrivibrio sp.]